MAKANSVSRFLRSLARAGKAQQRLVAKLVATSRAQAAKPSTSSSKKAPKRPPGIRQHNRPDVTAAPGKWIAGQFPGLSLRMNYWLYLPEHAPATVARHGWPLIVMLHGCHQSATQFAQATRMNHLAEKKGYAVLYPQQSLGIQQQRCWRW